MPCPQAGLAWLAMRWGEAGGGLPQEIVKLGEFLSHSGEAATEVWVGWACMQDSRGSVGV